MTADDRAFLDGSHGPGAQLAMRIVVRIAETTGADRLLNITRAHIDSCVFYGVAGLEFSERLRDGGARVSVRVFVD